MKKNILLHVMLPLLIGGGIYIGFRSESLLLFQWIEHLGGIHLVTELRALTTEISLPNWVIYSLPDALWLYAFTYSILLIWEKQMHQISLGWLAIVFILGIGNELGQFYGIIPGTFDPIDLGLSILALFIPLMLLSPRKEFKLRNPIPFAKLSLSMLSCFFFVALSLGCGFSDAFVNDQIESEEDPIRREKMRRVESFYQFNNETYPNEEESALIDAEIQEMIQSGELDTTGAN